MRNFQLIQLIPPMIVLALLSLACYYFFTRYVRPSRMLRAELRKITSTIRSMSDGDEGMRKTGVAKAFQNTSLEGLWKDFAKSLHQQQHFQHDGARSRKARMTVPPSYFFSVSAVIERPLAVDYFKHLPGLLTGVGIIGTFSGLLFGLSNFNASSPELMTRSIAFLLSGVRDAFYASAAAITAAMVITHWEKMLYRACLQTLDELVEALNNLFEAGVNEEYLSVLVQNSANSRDEAKNLRDELIQAMVPVIKQMERIQTQQMDGFGEVLTKALNESNRRLVNQLETVVIRQIKTPIEEMGRSMENRLSHIRSNPSDLAMKVIRARGDGVPEVPQELS